MKKTNTKKGFTIIELVIVIAVIGILAAVLIPTFSNVIEKANIAAAQEEAKNALVARFDSILTDNGATVVESKDWEKRRLAYEIQDFREGLYHVVNVESDNDFALNEFDRLSKINGDILRHMIVKLDA